MQWARDYIGRPYSEMDCAALLNRVNSEQFGRDVDIPTTRPDSPFGRAAYIDAVRSRWAETNEPTDGDAVLMKCRRLWHIGVYGRVLGESAVLHSISTAGVVLTRVRDLPRLGIQLQGFYQWRG